MRIIYTDEAGTSGAPHEVVRVVASIIVHGDSQYRYLINEVQRIIKERVPLNIRDGFIFHALEVFNGGKRIDRNQWPFTERLDFLKEIVCLPFVNDVPISLGVVFAGYHEELGIIDDTLATNVTEHGVALSTCMERADLFLRKYLNGDEIGIIVAENLPRLKDFFSEAAIKFRTSRLEAPSEHMRQSSQQKILGIQPKGNNYKIDHIIDVPHFVSKSGAPLLQLADACAFSFRRCLSRQADGDDLVLAMLGPVEGRHFLDNESWFSKSSSGLFITRKYWPFADK